MAQEIKRLAESSSHSTKSVHNLIARVKSEIETVVTKIQSVYAESSVGKETAVSSDRGMNQMEHSIEHTHGSIEQLSKEIERINAALGQVENQMESFSAISQQSAAQSQEINTISERQYENSMKSRELASLVAH